MEKELTIDLSKKTLSSSLLNQEDITCIRFDNYSDKIEGLLALNEFPKITKLSFYGESKENLFETPDNLEKLIHIRELTLWRYCDLSKINVMPHIEELYITVENVETDTKQIITLFPKLKKITVLGDFLKKELLPIEIGNLHALESITLIECGVSAIPDSIANLKQLKELKLRGLPLKSFPEVITQLESLETLEIRAASPKLPNSLSNLKNLKKLNLSYALNEANINVFELLKQEKLYLKPIPEVIGKLENLEELNLSVCGVFDIAPIISLKKLKKLEIVYAALKNCDDFSNFTKLEELNLDCNHDLKNLEGLKGLPIKKLNISSNYLESIETISTLEYLETLDIKNCYDIKDYSPIYIHPTLKELNANDEILKNWKKKDKFKALPSIDALIAQLETNDILQFEETISYLSKHVKANYSGDDNPLAGFFGIETEEEEEEITEIPLLDLAIEKHIKKLSNVTLATIFQMTFKSVGYDNYNATLIILKEVIARRDVETQNKVIKKFYKAYDDDTGSRLWCSTVLNQLIDNWFAQFTSESLYQLLKKASTDMLNSEYGDKMEGLFIPALRNSTDLDLQDKILDVFFKYEEEARPYYRKNYFDTLLQKIKNIASPELKKLIATKKEENKEKEELITTLENLNKVNLATIIEILGNTVPKKIEEEYLYKIVKASQEKEISEKTLDQLIIFLIHGKQNSYLAKLLQAKYHKTNPEKIITILNQSLANNSLNENESYNLALGILSELVCNKEVSFNDLEIYRNFIVSKCNISIDIIYNNEIEKLLSKYFDTISNRYAENHIYLLDKVKEIFSKTEAEFSYKDLFIKTDLLLFVINGAIGNGNEQCRMIFNYLYPRITNYADEAILYLNIIASIKLNDFTYFDTLLKEVQKLEEITGVLLTFNLAYAFAHFGRKDEMLHYIIESMQLGITKEQFLTDSNFERYWKDEDFLKVIEEN